MNKKYTLGWVLWILGFLALEFAAIRSKQPDATLSAHVRGWIGTNSKTRTALMWTARIGLGTLVAWLVPHWFTGAV